jgi:hypothetical protein
MASNGAQIKKFEEQKSFQHVSKMDTGLVFYGPILVGPNGNAGFDRLPNPFEKDLFDRPRDWEQGFGHQAAQIPCHGEARLPVRSPESES